MSDYIKDAEAHSELLSTELYKTLEKADWSKRHKIFSNIYEYGHSGELFVKAFGEEIILTLNNFNFTINVAESIPNYNFWSRSKNIRWLSTTSYHNAKV
ncbi:MAG: hypothetical protein J4451_02715 [DPANN group archaeon]|nr:hypothetical protein [DPANN group archaeon]